ncbi:uncharacterized protein LOC141876020 isoform X2 [Acropora palmata]|uniref:uncharacterized protein LOC141876020 isoform X2 n=1 Tax=Acropora palmata TaxID=6131 RepID=UPI003DA08AB4
MAVVSVFCRTFSNRAICFKKVKRRMFHTFGLKDILIKRLKDINISNPTPIQEKALRPVLEGNDTIINAETGSGKTLCYLLPIINKLLSSENILSRPPYAVVLLPSIELCNQVASVFQSLTDHTMAPCLVHKESKLFVNRKYPIIVATPDSLFNYGLSSLSNVQVVVTDEADFLITGGGDVVWEILSFFKGVDSLKTKRRQRRLARRQKVSREPNAVQGSIESFDPKTQKEKKLASATPDCHNELLNAPISAPKRQFVFVAATLPHHGPKAAFNVLKEWIPEAQLVSTDLAHHPVPTVGISYMRVHEANKLPTLLLCLNVLAGVIKNPLKNYGMKISMDGEKTVGSNSVILTREELDVPTSHQYQSDRNDISFLECVGLTNLRVLVFANSWKMAEQAFNFLRVVRETDGNDFIVLKLQNDVTTTRCGEKTDCDVHSGTASSFFEKIGDQDIWKGRVGLIHKKLSVNERIENLDKFKSGQLKVLICTDLGSRGLDIPKVTHVIQLDFAPNATAVLHRTGRTARAGSSGKVGTVSSDGD